MDKQWFPAAGILLAAFLVVSASTLTLLSTDEGPKQFPSAPGTSPQQSNNSILLGILTHIFGKINSVERESEALGRRAGDFSTEGAGSQESPPLPDSSGRVIPEPIPSTLTISASYMAVDSQPVSSEADPIEEILALGTLDTITMSSPQPSPIHGSEQKFNKTFGLCGTVPASATLEKTVVSKQTGHLSKTSHPPIFSRPPCLLRHNPNPTVRIPRRDGHSRPDASSSVVLAPSTSLRLPIFPRMSNILKATEPPLSSSPGRLGTSIPVQVSSVTTGASDSSKPASVIVPSTTDSSIKTSNLTPQLALQPSHPEPWLPTSPVHIPTLSLQYFSSPPSTPHSSGFTESSVDADPTLASPLPYPGQDESLQDLRFSTPGSRHTIHTVTFRINRNRFTKLVWNLVPLDRWLICYQLRLIYHEAFSNFKNVSALLFRPGSTKVKASLVFGPPAPSALEILWTLYRKVKSSRWSLGYLSLADHGLSSDGYNMNDLTREIINVSFTLMRPFLPELLLPSSQPFILLEKQILRLETTLEKVLRSYLTLSKAWPTPYWALGQAAPSQPDLQDILQVTHEVSRFYKAEPQDQPLLLFSDVKEWVRVYMEYKLKHPIPIHLQGLASHLAHHITDPTLQKSSILANGEKADLVFYDTWLLIVGHPFTEALENKTSSEFQELQGLLTKRLTSVLQPLQNFGQVVVEEFHQEPLTARVQTAFFGVAPAQGIIQDSMLQALASLQETEGLQLEMLLPVLGAPSSRASRSPRGGAMLNLQLIMSLFILVALRAAPPPYIS